MEAIQTHEESTNFQAAWAALQETDYRMERLFGVTNYFGEVADYMLAPYLREKFREMGLNFPLTSSGSVVSDYDNGLFLEFDVILENGDRAMLVEVKTKLSAEDVTDHAKRLEKMRAYADLYGDKHAFLGAVAGVAITPDVKEYALGQGFYVIEPFGESFNITPPDGKPKEW
jgi:hypothetical protein